MSISLAARALPWLALIVVVALAAALLTAKTKRSRQGIFFALCGIAVLAAGYGWTRIAIEGLDRPYFKTLGLPLALIVAGTLCFAALVLDRIFDTRSLQRKVYPGLAWYLAAWVAVSTAHGVWLYFAIYRAVGIAVLTPLGLWLSVDTSSGRGEFVFVPVASFIADLFTLLGFVVSAMSGFSLRLFQVLFPAAAVVTLIAILENYVFLSGGKFGHIAVAASGEPFEALQRAVANNTWHLFWIAAFFYLNAQLHKNRLQGKPILEKLPKGAVVLIVVSFLRDFPEYNRFAELFPKTAATVQAGVISADLILLVLMIWLAIRFRSGENLLRHEGSRGE